MVLAESVFREGYLWAAVLVAALWYAFRPFPLLPVRREIKGWYQPEVHFHVEKVLAISLALMVLLTSVVVLYVTVEMPLSSATTVSAEGDLYCGL